MPLSMIRSHQGLSPQGFWAQNLNIFFAGIMILMIPTQSHLAHVTTVVTCDNLWLDWIIIFQVRISFFFSFLFFFLYKIWTTISQSICEIGTWCHSFCVLDVLINQKNTIWGIGTASQYTLQWRHNGSNSVSNRHPHDCFLNRLFRRRSKETSKLRVTGLCEGNSPGTGEFTAQMASCTENVSIWWRHHDNSLRISLMLLVFITCWSEADECINILLMLWSVCVETTWNKTSSVVDICCICWHSLSYDDLTL